jgi:anion-transporting  ArsA/GET3 family ATPase
MSSTLARLVAGLALGGPGGGGAAPGVVPVAGGDRYVEPVEPKEFCTQTRVLIVAGKGGVGKTTVTAAVARMAADAGLRCLIVEVEGRSGLGRLFNQPEELTYTETVLAESDSGAVLARTLTPDDALLEYLMDHGLRRVSKRLVSTGTLDVVATAVPGIKDILVLGKVKQLERAGAADLLVVDAPAAGHAVQFLASPRGLLDAVGVGPIRTQAADVAELLSDPARCQVMLVTLPEETPVNEVVDTAFQLEDRAGVKLAPVVVNGIYPRLDLDGDPAELAAAARVRLDGPSLDRLRRAAAFRRHRQELQEAQIQRLTEALPLPQLHLPFLFTTDLAAGDVEALASALRRAVEKLDAAAAA